MNISDKIELLAELGNIINQNLTTGKFDKLLQEAHDSNGWFTRENTTFALQTIADKYLSKDKLEKWLSSYQRSAVSGQQSAVSSQRSAISDQPSAFSFQHSTFNLPKNIALILAGNIPLVGFHDVLCVFLSGHRALIKQSSKDKILLTELVKIIAHLAPELEPSFQFMDRLAGMDAVIATGSDNTSRYFEYYFGKYPHIIRKNRSSIAVISPDDSDEDLALLSKDIFIYFGLGCRNVSKIFLPAGYDIKHLIKNIQNYHDVINHSKYHNNYIYNQSLLLLNGTPHLDNGFILFREDDSLFAPIGMLYYEYYNSIEQLDALLLDNKEKLQVIVSNHTFSLPVIPFGTSQEPELWDYADGVDTMKFLIQI